MRISDWSSDVCYSDLRVTNRLCCLAQAGKCVLPLWKGHGPFPAGPRRGAKFAPFHKGKWDQAAVTQTVRPSSSNGGRPTPAGMDWPPLPQLTMPSSRAMSWPMQKSLVRAVGQAPLRVDGRRAVEGKRGSDRQTPGG